MLLSGRSHLGKLYGYLHCFQKASLNLGRLSLLYLITSMNSNSSLMLISNSLQCIPFAFRFVFSLHFYFLLKGLLGFQLGSLKLSYRFHISYKGLQFFSSHLSLHYLILVNAWSSCLSFSSVCASSRSHVYRFYQVFYLQLPQRIGCGLGR